MREWRDVLDEHLSVAEALRESGRTLDRIAEMVANCLRASSRVYTMGNGGSAADAQHIAAELLGRFKLDRLAQPALALTTDSSTLTAIGNDLGFDQIFSRQLEALLQSGDLVWLLSTSGNSPNILKAAELARQMGIETIAFTGQSGGKLASLCTATFRAPHTSSDRIQEMHLLAYHYVCERVEEVLA
jgi:D-sedoheptulose 7-phosphate isomerase